MNLSIKHPTFLAFILVALLIVAAVVLIVTGHVVPTYFQALTFGLVAGGLGIAAPGVVANTPAQPAQPTPPVTIAARAAAPAQAPTSSAAAPAQATTSSPAP